MGTDTEQAGSTTYLGPSSSNGAMKIQQNSHAQPPSAVITNYKEWAPSCRFKADQRAWLYSGI